MLLNRTRDNRAFFANSLIFSSRFPDDTYGECDEVRYGVFKVVIDSDSSLSE